MELHQTDEHYILQDGEFSLWCSRTDGKMVPKTGSALATAWNPVCLGTVDGVIGKIKVHPESNWRLLLIAGRKIIGTLPGGHDVYCITRIVILPLADTGHPELDIERCKKHHFGMKKTKMIMLPAAGQQNPLGKTWNSLKAAAQVKKKEVKEREKHEKRITEELHKMFTESEWFYYSPTGDLTNTQQRYHSKSCNGPDYRFFWNQHMLADLFEAQDEDLASHWLVPIIQGCVQIRHCTMKFDEEENNTSPVIPTLNPDVSLDFKLILISRRSKHRAGTRYRRRGIDEEGACANYVETEQMIETMNHTVSYVQVRGSVPVFWSQPGIKYKPPPRLEKDEDETHVAFEKHFDEHIGIYKHVAIINLIEQSGREDIIGQAFLKHVLRLDSPMICYITFDFHDYCRGLKFENVSVLIDSIKDVVKDMRFCWVDKVGVILEQRSVFRINCMDCLDRTNVVQSALARTVLSMQLRKLGLLLPEQTIPPNVRSTYQEMWANNGDLISRQYAGTAALKGDFTRTGERKVTGLMKDGYYSANRYLQTQFKDAYRQVTIDLMQGTPDVEEDLSVITEQKEAEETVEEMWREVKEENIKQLIQHCLKLLVPKHEVKHYIGGWALISCDPIDPDESEDNDRDVILLVTEKAYYIASYDDDAEKITQYERINIEDLEAIGIGSASAFFSHTKHRCIRVYHYFCEEGDYFHTLKALPTKNSKEAEEMLHVVIESFATARASNNLGLKVIEDKMEKKRRKPPEELIKLTSQKRLTMWLQDKFVPELVIKKHSEPRPKRKTTSSRLTANHRPAKTQAVGRYFQNMGNKMSNLNPLRKVRLKNSMLNGPLVIFKKDNDRREAHDSDFEVDKDDDDSDDIVSTSSSSSLTSYDALSIEDCLDVIGGNVDGDPELFLNIPSMCKDEEVMLTSCGPLATSLSRNKRVLSRRHICQRRRSRSGPYEDTNAQVITGLVTHGNISPMVLSSAPEEDSSVEERKDTEDINILKDVFEETVQSKEENQIQMNDHIPTCEPLSDILPKTEAVHPEDDSQKSNDNNQMPNDDNQMPEDNNQMPDDNNQMPIDNNQKSNDNNQMPNDDNQMPEDNNQMPDDNNQMPIDNNQMPNEDNQKPNDNEGIQTADVRNDTEENANPKSIGIQANNTGNKETQTSDDPAEHGDNTEVELQENTTLKSAATKPLDRSTPLQNIQNSKNRKPRRTRPELYVSVAKDELGEMEVTVNPLPEFLNNEFELCDLAPSPRSPLSKSPQKSHSENSLADYLKNENLRREDSAGSGELSQSSQDSGAGRRFRNPFRNLNLNVNFNRGSNLRESLLKAKQQLQLQMQRSKTRFIQV